MRIYVDYNAETPDGRFFARLARLPEPVEIGQVFQTHDDDGNGLVVQVDDIDGENGLVYLRPDWSTWVDEDSPRVMAAGAIRIGNAMPRPPHRPANSLLVPAISVRLSHLAIRSQTDETVRTILVRPQASSPV